MHSEYNERYLGSTVSAIKEAVGDSLRAADVAVEVHSTEYFNNTYSPDFVLSWPGQKEIRKLYLRTDSNPAYLKEDVEIVGDDESILMPLAHSVTSEKGDPELQELSERRRVLVANSDSVDALAQESKQSPYGGLISRAILQGGKGLVRRERAESIAEAVAEGFESASRSSPTHIEQAVEVAHGVLDTPRSNAIDSFLQALWIASGARADTFPVPVAATPSVDASSLAFLLEMPELEDDEFWLRIGSNIDMERILGSGISGSTANLQRLMRVNAPRFRARICRVVETMKQNKAQNYQWFIGEGGLGLHLGDFSAIFTNRRISDIDAKGVDSTQSVDSLGERASFAGVHLVAVSIAARDRRIEYTADERFDLAHDKQLSDVASALGRSAGVQSATATVGASRRRLICNFTDSTSHGNSNAKYYLSEMALTALPLFVDLSTRELNEVQDAVGGEEAVRLVKIETLSDPDIHPENENEEL